MEKQLANNRTASNQSEIQVGAGDGHLDGSPVVVNWNDNGGENLAGRFGIDNRGIAQRRQFIRLGEEERELLAGLAPWASSVASQIAKEFYDWQFDFGPTRAFFENFARANEVSLSDPAQST